MPSDQDESELSPDAPNIYGKKDLDSDARWIKNLGALETTSVALAGLRFTTLPIEAQGRSIAREVADNVP
ncbi:MAG: hypothetical protein WAN65_20495 [Candidatus Sulfotelmatobacter sp.]